LGTESHQAVGPRPAACQAVTALPALAGHKTHGSWMILGMMPFSWFNLLWNNSLSTMGVVSSKGVCYGSLQMG
jgi:hypothetical protein